MSRAPRSRQRGFALLIVLLALALLSLLTARLMSDGRSALAEASDLRDAAVAEAGADGAVHQAIFQLLRGAWAADGKPHVGRIGAATAAVTARDEQGRINPNRSVPLLLTALLIEAGAQSRQAADLAAAIVDWRTVGDIRFGAARSSIVTGAPGCRMGLPTGRSPAWTKWHRCLDSRCRCWYAYGRSCRYMKTAART